MQFVDLVRPCLLDLVPEKPKKVRCKHKIDIENRLKHRCNTVPIFRSIFFPVITLSYICFLLNTVELV